jgi:hypothetical protein
MSAIRTRFEAFGPVLREYTRRFIRLRVALDLLVAGFVARVVYVLSLRLTYSSVSYDEQYFMWCGWGTLKGATPYKDFHAFKPPMVGLVNAAALGLFGLPDQRFRLLFQALAVSSLLSLLVALLLRGVDRILAGAYVLLLAGLFLDGRYHDSSLNDAESIGLSFYLYGIALLFARAKRRRLTEPLAGALLALCVLSKEPFSLAVGPTWLCFLFFEERLDRGKALAYAKRTLSGVGVAVGAVLLYLVLSGGLPHYLRMLKDYAPFSSSYCVTIGRFTPVSFWPDLKQNWTILKAEFFDAGAAGPLVIWAPFLLAAFAMVTRRRLIAVVFASLAFVGGFFAVTIGHCHWLHYYNMSFTGLSLLAGLGLVGLSEQLERLRGPRNWARLTLALSTYLAIAPRYDAGKAQAAYNAPKYGPFAPDLVEFIRSQTTDRDYVLTTGAPSLNVYTDRRGPATESIANAFLDELLVVLPGETDEQKLAPLRAELQRTMPRVVYLDPDGERRRWRFQRALLSPFLTENNFKEVRPHVWVHEGER